jgi:hypothetical protein
LATIPGTNPVRMADNGTELAIHDGGTTGYVWSAGALTIPVNLGSVSDVAYMDGYFVWTVANSDQFIISGLRDGLSYDPWTWRRSKARRTILMGVVNDHRELLFFGGSTGATPSTEIWVDTGNADFPFERQGNAFIERGCIDKDSIAKLDNAPMFVGDDRIVYRMDGYTPGGFRPMRLRKHLAAGELVPGLHLHAGRPQILRASTPTPVRGPMMSRPDHGPSARASGWIITARLFSRCLRENARRRQPDRQDLPARLRRHTENGDAIPLTIELPPSATG